MSRPGVVSCLLLLILSASCRSLTDVEFRYQECVRQRAPFVENFDEEVQGLLDRCWKAANVAGENGAASREMTAAEGDLVIGYSDVEMAAEPWNGTPPALLRRIEGNFVIATRVEAASGLDSGFCDLKPGDAAGILIRGAEVDASADVRAAFLVRPSLDGTGLNCQDNAQVPPKAIAEAPGGSRAVSPEIGSDGEADIAVCRRGTQVTYFFRNPTDPEAAWTQEDWQRLALADTPGTFRTDEIGAGPVEVGLTTTMSETGLELQIQGYFNWVAVLTEGAFENCMSPLESFKEPKSD